MIEPMPRRLSQDRGEAGEYLIHYRLRDGFETFPVPGGEIEGARLVATNHADRPGARVVERNRESASAGEAPAGGDGQDDRRPCKFV